MRRARLRGWDGYPIPTEAEIDVDVVASNVPSEREREKREGDTEDRRKRGGKQL